MFLKTERRIIIENNYLKRIKNSIVDFREKHPVITGIVERAVIAGIGYYIGKKIGDAEKRKLSNEISELSNQNDGLRNLSIDLIDENESLSSMLKKSTASLHQKNLIMDATMSDGLRSGSSECGRQMAYKRWS